MERKTEDAAYTMDKSLSSALSSLFDKIAGMRNLVT